MYNEYVTHNLPMQFSQDILKKIIVGSGFVTEAEFEDAAKTASELNKDTTDVLIFRGLINEDTVGKLISEHYGVPFANIRRLNIDPDILGLIPEKMARVYRILPFEREGNRLKLAMENPEDFEALEFAKTYPPGNRTLLCG
jgi:type IV pilus assembly protein PilB